ncbi:MAG: ParA family protein [Caldilineae bacterium]|nr:ParA family protein [Bdellovibrionales bacterium]MCB9177028.1 ParA family protein [Caldilineae bacterium]
MIIAVASQKGGTGKTTTSISLAAGLAKRKHEVLLIDVDPQANASKVVIPDYSSLRKEQTLFATILQRNALQPLSSTVSGLDAVASHILLSNTDIELATAKDHREARLKAALKEIAPRYDHIVIDCPPTLSWLTLNALTAADQVIVPIAPGYFELDSVVQLGKTIEEVKELFNPELQLAGFLFTMADPTINSRTSLKILRQTYTESVFSTVIPRNTDMRDAHFNKQDVFSFKPDAKAAQAYDRLIDELLHEQDA